MNLLTIIASIVGSIVGALTAGTMVTGFLKRYTQRVFDDDVIGALRRQKAQYREFHADVFSPELERGRRTADIAQGLSRDIQSHIAEFQRFRLTYDGHHEQLVLIPRTVIHLDESIKELNKTFREYAEASAELRTDISTVRTDVDWLKRNAKL